MLRTLPVIFALAALPLQAQIDTCGTTPDLQERTREIASWSEARAQLMASKGLHQSTAALKDNVIYLEADDTNTPYRAPFDLSGRTLVFTPSGNGFAVRNIASTYDSNRGTEFQFDSSDEPVVKVSLGFDFPFLGFNVRDLYVTSHNAIYLDGPPQVDSSILQYNDLDLASVRQPVIAPLLSTARSQSGRPILRVRKAADSVVISWSGATSDVQAVLSRSGEIRFSYGTVTKSMFAAGVVVTSGREAWRNDAHEVLSVVDGAGDIAPTRPDSVDIVRAELRRISNVGLYELKMQMRGNVVPQASQSIGFGATFGDRTNARTIRLTIPSSGAMTYRVPVLGNVSIDSATVDGAFVTMRFTAEQVLATGSVGVQPTTYIGSTLVDATTTMPVQFPASTPSVRTDFSGVTTTTIENAPVVEAFTAPVLNVSRVWEQVKASGLPLKNEDIDGLAVYQTFYTDIVLYAGAYSTGGNSGASGIEPNDQQFASQPRFPALMHMNTVGYGHNRTQEGASRVVLHEFGHRWLLFVSIDENGTQSRVLNPVSAHPAQYVDTRAAFKVYTDLDTSVMGGGIFTPKADGTYSTGPYGPYGYSWLDLYLMGLADASEVKPFFYLADADPELGGEYYAPANATYRGTRKDVTLDQVISSTGLRVPAARDSQKNFRVVFVLLTEPGKAATPFEISQMQQYRTVMEKDFSTATNTRGSISTVVPEPPAGPRRRAARR